MAKMGKLEINNKLPAIAMSSLQLITAIMVLLTRAALLKGMSPRVFIFYRQSVAALVICPIAFFSRVKSSRSSSCMGFKSFGLIFVTAFIGAVLNQSFYTEGLYLSSSSTATAMSNLVPAVTFLLAAVVGMEKVDLRRLSTIAKILGTSFSVGGAASMALLKGPKLLNVEQLLPQSNSILLRSFGDGDHTWLLGCLFLFGSSCCWSLWLILQVPIAACYPDHLSASAWMCLFSALQAGVVAFFFEKESSAWALTSSLELLCCCYAGIMGSGVQFVVQSWCISHRGPLFSAMFSPLCTVITTVIACLFLHEEIYAGSLLGGGAVIIGLYVVLWGKADEQKEKLEIEESFKDDLEQTLLLAEDSKNAKDDVN